MKRYDPKNWSKGERVRINPKYSWSFPKLNKVLEGEGTVSRIEETRLYVIWDGEDSSTAYSYADQSLIKIDKTFQGLPDELFKI